MFAKALANMLAGVPADEYAWEWEWEWEWECEVGQDEGQGEGKVEGEGEGGGLAAASSGRNAGGVAEVGCCVVSSLRFSSLRHCRPPPLPTRVPRSPSWHTETPPPTRHWLRVPLFRPCLSLCLLHLCPIL